MRPGAVLGGAAVARTVMATTTFVGTVGGGVGARTVASAVRRGAVIGRRARVRVPLPPTVAGVRAGVCRATVIGGDTFIPAVIGRLAVIRGRGIGPAMARRVVGRRPGLPGPTLFRLGDPTARQQ